MSDNREAASAPKKKKEPRPGWTYRGERKNAARSDGQPMLKHAPEEIEDDFAPAVELNRSKKWVRAASYAYAREISPSKEPVQ